MTTLIPIADIIKEYITEISEVGESGTSGVPGVNKSYQVTDSKGKKYIFKPASGEHTSRWRYVPAHTQYKRERAAYIVDKELGFMLVPLTKIATVNNEKGSLQEWVDDTQKSDVTLQTYETYVKWKLGLFDIIIGNIDRHSGNWLGVDDSVIAIDHGYSFPTNSGEGDPRSVILSRFAVWTWKKPIPKTYLASISKLKNQSVQRHLESILDSGAMECYNKRVDQMLSTGIAEVSGYRVEKKVKGIPPKK